MTSPSATLLGYREALGRIVDAVLLAEAESGDMFAVTDAALEAATLTTQQDEWVRVFRREAAIVSRRGGNAVDEALVLDTCSRLFTRFLSEYCAAGGLIGYLAGRAAAAEHRSPADVLRECLDGLASAAGGTEEGD